MRAATEEQIQLIYRETIDLLYGRVARRCGVDRALAEDIVQETWLRAVRHWRSEGLPASPIAWLTTVSRNLFLNEFRRRHPIPLDAIDEAALSVDQVDDDDADAEGALRDALARLPESQSRLLRAFHLDGRRIAQIARSLGLSERAVEGRLYRARQNLRNELHGLPCVKEEP